MRFVDRERELSVLEKAISSPRSELVVVYGRRRIGKTFLLRYFNAIYGGVYLFANYEERGLLLRDLSRQLSMVYGRSLGVYEDFHGLYAAALELAEKYSRGKPLLVIDEAQRLAGTGGLAELQHMWDTELSSGNVIIVLSGSGAGIVIRSLLGYDSPLYGRATRVIRLDMFGYREARVFMENWAAEDRVRGYSVYGGMPAYLSAINSSMSLAENIYENILNPSSFLHHDPLYMLSIETREPQRYLAVLSAIAAGRHRPGEIAAHLGLSINIVSKYLYVLEHGLGLIEKIYPLGYEGRKRHARYIIRDNYYRFWLRIIYPRLGDPALHTRSYLDKALRAAEEHASRVWEEIAREHMLLLRSRERISFTAIGPWWRRGTEIDLVAIDEENKMAYFIECKWRRRQRIDRLLDKLRAKAEQTPWRSWTRRYILYLLGEPRGAVSSEATVYTLEDVEKDFEAAKPLVTTYPALTA